MRRLISPYKKFPSSNLKRFLLSCSVLFISLFIVFLSCKIRSESEEAAEMLSDLSDKGVLVPQEFGIEKGLQSSVFQSQIWLTSSKQKDSGEQKTGNSLVAIFDHAACPKITPDTNGAELFDNREFRFQVFINSVFGQDLAEVTFMRKSNERQIDVAVGDYVYTNILQHQENKKLEAFDVLLESACKMDSSSETNLLKYSVNQDVLDTFRNILQQVAPDCAFNAPESSGWFCSMNHGSIADVSAQLSDLKKHIVVHWQRASYAFVRRISMISLLTESVQKDSLQSDQVIQLDDFCKILQRSSPQEIPLTFVSKKWQKTVCSSADLSLRKTAAIIGIKSALREIIQLKDLFETNAKKGNVQILIANQNFNDPTAALREHIPHLKLRLRPVDLMMTLNEKTYNLSFSDEDQKERETSELEKDASTMGCWHPFLSEKESIYELAAILQLIGPEGVSEQNQTVCARHLKSNVKREFSLEDSVLVPIRYLNKILSTETEFVVLNGSQKYLRLLPGTYAYVIDRIPDDLSRLDTTVDQSQGQFSWSPKGNSRVVISEWK